MFFKGTPTRAWARSRGKPRRRAGYLNASTSYDHTSYFVVLPASALARAVDIQADALRHSLHRRAASSSASCGSSSRRRSASSTRPMPSTYETLHELMFDQHRIRRWRIGTEEQLAGYTRDDVAGLLRSRATCPSAPSSRWWVPSPWRRPLPCCAPRTVTGPRRPARSIPRPNEPRREGVRARTLRGDVTRAELVARLAHGAMPCIDDSVPLDVAAAVLSAGRGSWLYRMLRETGRRHRHRRVSNYAPGDLGVFSISADVEPSRVDQALEGIATATNRLALAGSRRGRPEARAHAAARALGATQRVDGGPRVRARQRRGARAHRTAGRGVRAAQHRHG